MPETEMKTKYTFLIINHITQVVSESLLVSHSRAVPLAPPSYLKGIGHGFGSQISIQNILSFLEQTVSECACLKLGTSLLRGVKGLHFSPQE